MRSTVLAVLSLLTAVPLLAGRLHIPGGISVEATGPSGAVVTYTASAEGFGSGDDENGRPNGGAATVSCHPASGSTFPLGTTHVNCSATDSTGTVTESFPVAVNDTTPPSLHLPSNISVNATSPNGATVAFSVSGTDLV